MGAEKLYPIIFTLFQVCWASVWAAKHIKIRRLRGYADNRTRADKNTRYRILSYFLYVSQTVLCIASFWSTSQLLLKIHNSDSMRLVGVILIAYATTLYFRSLNHLGRNYSPCFDSHVPLELICSGPYKLPPGSKSGWEVTVLRKDATFAPGRTMTINIDGKDMQGTMLPITGANGSSRLDYSGNEDSGEIVNWLVGANPDPFASLVDANHVTLTWANVNMVLPDDQVQSLRAFIREYNQETRRYVCKSNPFCMLRALISSKS